MGAISNAPQATNYSVKQFAFREVEKMEVCTVLAKAAAAAARSPTFFAWEFTVASVFAGRATCDSMVQRGMNLGERGTLPMLHPWQYGVITWLFRSWFYCVPLISANTAVYYQFGTQLATVWSAFVQVMQ
jgi:hypothetical protein